eukprot:7295958-Heterocapsa_arctica.AAC.1
MVALRACVGSRTVGLPAVSWPLFPAAAPSTAVPLSARLPVVRPRVGPAAGRRANRAWWPLVGGATGTS